MSHKRLLSQVLVPYSSCNCKSRRLNPSTESLYFGFQLYRNFSRSANRSKKKDLEREAKLPIYDYGKFDPERKRLYVFGQAGTGGLGLANLLFPSEEKNQRQIFYIHRPVRNPFGEFHRIKDIAAGHGFTLVAVKPEKQSNHVIFGTGNNTMSQLGYQPDEKRDSVSLASLVSFVPLPLPLDKTSKILALGAGRGHSIISVEGKGLIALGDNSFGQCGRKIIEDEEYRGSKYITRIPPFSSTHETDVTQLATRFDINVCVTRIGTVYTFGSNEQGQLGQGKQVSKPWIPREVQGDLKGEFVKKVATSGGSVLAVSEKGQLFGWGSNDSGQIDPSTASNIYYEPVHIKLPRRIGKVIDVAMGGLFTLILSEFGNVYVWGNGYALGLGPKTFSVKSPTLIPPPVFGRNEFSPDTAVVKIAASSSFAAAINSNKDLFTWGEEDRNGCLGLGKVVGSYQFFPLRVALGVPTHKVCLGEDHVVLLAKGSY